MGVTLRGPSGFLEACFRWEAPLAAWASAAHLGAGQVVLRDALHARAYAAALCGRPENAAALRRLASRELSAPLARMEDAALVDLLGRWLHEGKLRLTMDPARDVVLTSVHDEIEAPPPPSWRPTVKEVSEPPPPPPEEPTFALEIDAPRIAAGLTQAAEYGIPFCEECARKEEGATFADNVDPADFARVLRDAAQRGLPFCKSCEKNKPAGGSTS